MYDVVTVHLDRFCDATISYPEGSTFGTNCGKDPKHEGPHSAKVELLLTWNDPEPATQLRGPDESTAATPQKVADAQ